MPAAKVLCVDDDREVLKTLEGVLTQTGHDVYPVASVADALDLIGQQRFDVLITDLNIGQPGNGFTVICAMKRAHPNACTFILTGYPDIESAIQAILGQVDDVLTKPLNIQQLLPTMSDLITGKRPPRKTTGSLKVSDLMRKMNSAICERWFNEVMLVPELAAMHMSHTERVDHLPGLLEEVATGMERADDPLNQSGLDAVRAHGRTRYQQGYTIPQILLETRILQRILSATIQEDILSLDLSTLVADVFKIGEHLQSATEVSIRSYQAEIPRSLQTSFSMLYKSPYLGVAIADDSHIIDANDALLRMIGRNREELLAGNIDWLRMTPEKFHSLDQNAMEQLREFGACVPFEKEFILADGTTMPFLIGAVRLTLDPLQWSAYIVDLTQQRKLQTAEQKVREWESRHTVINRLAHEINNPLAALMFTLHLLRTHSGISEDARALILDAGEMLERINKSVQEVLIESRPVQLS